MRTWSAVPLLFLVASLSAQAAPKATSPLLPVPLDVSFTPARLRIDSTLSVAITSYRDARLERGVNRALRRLEGRISQAFPRTIGNAATARVVIVVEGPGFATPDLDENESYRLNVSADQAVLSAPTVVGALRGLETLLQLQETDSAGFFLRGATITDAPRFRWRGMLLDVSRHFHPVEVVKRIIDGMAALKLNVLHWHLSDDQGFRVESTKYPLLQQLGSDGDYYTQQQLRDVVSFATDRGVRVVPEFDVPGHTTAWLVGYPDISSGSGPYDIGRKWGVLDPLMDPTKPATYKFMEQFIAEMVKIFPDRYWHIGGDEVAPAQWNNNPAIQSWMKKEGIKNAAGLQTAFNSKLFVILGKQKREPVGWDEILQPDLPNKAVIQAWQGGTSPVPGMNRHVVDAVRQGRRVILSEPWYLDRIITAGEMYLADPLPGNNGLPTDQQALVLGGEACMWAEYVTAETVESRVFPRLGSIAERLWSPASVRDVPDMYRRLEITSRRLEELGLLHEGHSDRMIRRFATGVDANVFHDLLLFARSRGFAGRGTNQFSPLTRVVDASLPDPFTEYQMIDQVDRSLKGDVAATFALRNSFNTMVSLRPRLDNLTTRIPLAADGVPVATALRDVGRVGIEALDFLMRGEKPSAAWQSTADSIVMRNRGRTFGLLRPVGVDAVRNLIRGM